MYARWQVSNDEKKIVKEQMMEIVRSGSNRERIMAAKVLLEMESQNIAAENKPTGVANLQQFVINIAEQVGVDPEVLQPILDDRIGGTA